MIFTQLRKDATGYLEFVPPEGVPDGDVSLTIYVEGVETLTGTTWPQTLTAAASATLTAIAYAGSDVFSVSTVANFIRGHACQIVDANGSRYTVRLDGVDASDTQLKINRTFDDDLPIGTPITAVRYVFELSPTLTATSYRNLRAEWTYAVDGETVTRVTRFDIVAEPFTLDPTPNDIAAFDPKSAQRLGSIDTIRQYTRGALKKIRTDLAQQKFHPDLIRNRDALEEAAIYAILNALYGSDTQSLSVADRFERLYGQAIGKALQGEALYDADDDQRVDEGETLPALFMGVG